MTADAKCSTFVYAYNTLTYRRLAGRNKDTQNRTVNLVFSAFIDRVIDLCDNESVINSMNCWKADNITETLTCSETVTACPILISVNTTQTTCPVIELTIS